MKNLMFVGLIAAAGVAATAMPGAAAKRSFGDVTAEAYNGPLPPAGYTARRWSHPNGCDYSLAGRPGERVWYLIINTLGKNDCVRYFVEQSAPGEVNVTRNLYRYGN